MSQPDWTNLRREGRGLAQAMESAWASGCPVLVEAFLEQNVIPVDSFQSEVQELIRMEITLRKKYGCPGADATFAPRLSEWDISGDVISLKTNLSATQFDEQKDVNDSLPDHTIIDRLGKGSQAPVFLANDCLTKRLVALKRYDQSMPPNLAGLNNKTRRILREGCAIPRHQSLNQIYQTHFPSSHNIIILEMEYIPGPPLAIYTGQNRCQPHHAAIIIAQLSRGLATLHQSGKLHRDIKPQNILFRRDGCPVLVDYGLIYHVTNEAEKSSILASVTDVGEKPSGPGTPLYMSPEADERNYEPSTDIAALGYIFYELLTGRIANIRDEKDSPTKSILLERRKNSMPVPPHDHDARVPIPLSDLCMEMIGWKDNVRSIPIKNAYQVVDRIEQFLANSKAVTTAPNNNLARTSLFAALSCVALAGVVAYPYMMPRSTPTTVVVGQPTTTELYRAIRNDLRAVPNRPTTTRYIRLDLVPHSYREAVRDSLTSIFGTNIRALQDMPLLLALDLSATGWTNDTWKQVTGDAYPYRMTPGAFPNNGEWADLVNEVQNNLLDRQIPCVRGDWLLDYLSSPVAKELRPKGWNNSADDIAQRYREIQINLEIAGIETGLGAEEFTRRSILIEDRNRLPKAILDVMDGQSINRSDWENSFQKILLPMRIGAIR